MTKWAQPEPKSDTPKMLVPRIAWVRFYQRTGMSVDRATFYNWLASGKIYSVRVGRSIFIPVQALEEFIKKCLVE